MTLFLPIGIGILGFALWASAEWAGYKQIRIIKPVLWISLIPVFTIAIVLAWTNTNFFFFPKIFTIIAWIVLPFFTLLFLYSLFLEIPLRKTYVYSEHPIRVVTTGTYSLCRHPAFLWFTGWQIAIVFISGSITLAIATPIWILSYIVCLFLEEKVCCRAAFADEYQQYQLTTPMLIPSINSIRNFRINTRSRLSMTRSWSINRRKEIE